MWGGGGEGVLDDKRPGSFTFISNNKLHVEYRRLSAIGPTIFFSSEYA